MSSTTSFTILIIGGGVAGLAASIGLRRKGHKVLVLESSTTLQTLGGSLLIPPNAARVLDSYGLWEKFKASETIPVGNTTFRYQDGKVLEEVEYAAMEGAFGYPYVLSFGSDVETGNLHPLYFIFEKIVADEIPG